MLLHEKDPTDGESTDYIYLDSKLIARRDLCTADTDRDGIPGCVELQYGLNPNDPSDAMDDPDRDGATNLQENNAGTNFFDADTDRDGMPDGYEIRKGLDPTVNDASGDKDRDGLRNLQEFSLGTDPGNADTDNDGLVDGADPDPTLNPASLVPAYRLLLQ